MGYFYFYQKERKNKKIIKKRIFFVMGWSRVRTGEHFIDDVIAGWLFGATCVIGIHLLYYYFVPNL